VLLLLLQISDGSGLGDLLRLGLLGRGRGGTGVLLGVNDGGFLLLARGGLGGGGGLVGRGLVGSFGRSLRGAKGGKAEGESRGGKEERRGSSWKVGCKGKREEGNEWEREKKSFRQGEGSMSIQARLRGEQKGTLNALSSSRSSLLLGLDALLRLDRDTSSILLLSILESSLEETGVYRSSTTRDISSCLLPPLERFASRRK
jgi:hypothetical protein